MRKTQKKILFLCLVLFFILSSSFFVFYSQGYRFDFKNKKIVQTGGLFLKIIPSGVKIYLNGKYLKKTNFLFNSLFLNNLIPNEYTIQVQKEGYHSWEKTLPIEELKVTEAKYIMLFPKKIDFQNIEGNIQQIFPSPSNEYFILQKKINNTWQLVLLSSSLQKEVLLNEEDISSSQTQKTKLKKSLPKRIQNIIWASNERKILLQLEDGNQIKHLLVGLENKKIQEINLKDIKIREIKFHPKDSNTLYALGAKINQVKEESWQMFIIKAPTFLPAEIKLSPDIAPITFDFINGDIVWLNKDGFLFRGVLKNQSGLSISEIFNLRPKKIQQDTNYRLKLLQGNIFLFEGEKLFWLDPTRHLFVPVSDAVEDMQLSPDNKKIAISTGHQIWLFYLQDDYQQPRRFVLERFLLTTSESAIKNIAWLNPYYLIIGYGNGIKITEIDNRSRLNEVIISEFRNPQIFWVQNKKRLFAFSEQKVFFTDDILK
ncbi:PEGA domain-containing protein [bacterium]|nr:PEGA domain-containing protein [bacterium]